MTHLPNPFAPFEDLAAALLPHAGVSDDGSHDLAHLQRVFHNAMRIQALEGGDADVLAAAVLLHDCVSVEKNSPLRSEASRLAAEKACHVLKDMGWEKERIDQVAHAILTHSFSAGIAPQSVEAKILQDADRLDAIGLMGVARCFYTAGRMKSGLYDPIDPRAADRSLDGSRFALDHFVEKLLKLSDGFQTETGRRLAKERHESLERFYTDFLREITA
ncbi:HD domain-containing protein [Rhizobium paknamense]|uniref:HD domain-containing protein n=1 Tax=Rhizobium paknamense TaxID=1206817 RepID=A0ABU0I992_9HYPH|nr:HD domain-containing protein [Rhizobium paknamense]MDQ0454193.1 uncharacterized protein [Rhizobium paknamense]